jgi:hypothetical protein
MINQVKKTRFSKEKSDCVQLSRAYLKKIPLTDNKKKIYKILQTKILFQNIIIIHFLKCSRIKLV